MSNSEIVSMEDEELCVWGVAETLGDFVGLGDEVQREKQRYYA
jgi:hypothetical protein